ncbi:MAG TPA: translation initiation factor IF-3 [Candidatus Limnocylindria bacterium]|nr:translation initiation factor IF-3 [Candidatus Limnocylindria bacterium]
MLLRNPRAVAPERYGSRGGATVVRQTLAEGTGRRAARAPCATIPRRPERLRLCRGPPGGIRASFEREATISRDLRINEMIRIPQVRVIDEEDNQLGVMPTPQALEMAQERGLDLVEVAPMAAPPVARFLNFGQYKYELTKREKENKRRQRSVTFKEVRLSPKIGVGDFQTKMHRAVEFLEDGDRIKVTVRFRGRELSHPELGRGLLERFAKQVEEHGVIERAPVLEGKSMFIVLASTHKPKVVETPQRPAREGDAEATATEAPATAAPAAEANATEASAAPATETAAAAPKAAAAVPAEATPVAAAPAAKPAKPVEPNNGATATPAPVPTTGD